MRRQSILIVLVMQLLLVGTPILQGQELAWEPTRLAWLQQPPTPPPVLLSPSTTPPVAIDTEDLEPNPRRFRRSQRRLARAPDIFGDFFGGGMETLQATRLLVGSGSSEITWQVPVLLGGGARRISIAEQNSAVARDRVAFYYNHFHNVAKSGFHRESNLPVSEAAAFRPVSVSRYTLAAEKTIGFLGSLEIRLPMAGRIDEEADDFDSLSGRTGSIGNLAFIWKQSLYATESLSTVAGLGVEVPTGSDSVGSFPLFDATSYRFHNEAVHLSPYAGILVLPADRLSFQAFLQVDVAAGGNTLTLDEETVGVYQPQTLLHFDVEAAYWIYQNFDSSWLTGIALVTEAHFTSTLNEADAVTQQITSPAMGLTETLVLSNANDRMNILNLTFGLHTELTQRTSVRVGAVLPVSNDANRLFDSEVQASVIRDF